MEDWDLIELDSGKGERLLDIVAYRKWQVEQCEDIDTDEVEARGRKYDGMRAEAKVRYEKLKADIAALTPLQSRRLFQYLQGRSLLKIAESENPQVSHYTIRDTLRDICKKWNIEGLNSAKAIWQYGKLYLD